MVNLKSKLKQAQKQRWRAACDESCDHSPVPDIVLGNHSYVPAIK